MLTLLCVIFTLSQLKLFAQCTNTSSYMTIEAPTTGTINIANCSFSNEYATITNVAANTSYQSSSVVPATLQETGYVTIRQGSFNGPVIAHGPSPLTWNSTVAGNYFAHWNLDANCATDFTCIKVNITYLATAPSVPPTPIQAAGTPECATGSVLTVSGTPATDVTWYWQTSSTGTSYANPYLGPWTVYANDTYYIRAHYSTTNLWSNASSVTVTNFPTVATPNAPVAATNPACITSGTTISMTTPPAGFQYYWQGTTVNGRSLDNPASVPYSVISSGSHTVAAYETATQCWSNTSSVLVEIQDYIPPTPTTPTNNLTFCIGSSNVLVEANHASPATINWFDAATNGNIIGTGQTLNLAGTSLIPNTTVAGEYNVYAGSTVGACTSSLAQVEVELSAVSVQLIAVDATCNGGDNGSFTLGTVQCGSGDFQYSIDGGTTYGQIPTNLTAGTYQVLVRDQVSMSVSFPISLEIGQPGVPLSLNAYDISLYNGKITWTPQGNETTWNVEYGPAGFTQGSSPFPMLTGLPTNVVQLTDLTANTSYQFYVQAGCSSTSEWAGPYTFSTQAPFTSWDTECGPGYTSIHTTGTALNIADNSTTSITTVTPVTVGSISSNSVMIGNDGWIQVAQATFMPWYTNLGGQSGNVYWQETTIGNDDYLIIEWYQRPLSGQPNNQNVTFQIAINHTTNEVFYLYQDKVFGGNNSNYDYAGSGGLIAAEVQQTLHIMSESNQSFLQNNSCVRFFPEHCPNVEDAEAYEFINSVEIIWNPGQYNENEWTVVYGLEGFDPTNSSEVIGSQTLIGDAYIFIEDLTQMTCYDAYIYAECAQDNITSSGYLLNFCTKSNCANPYNIAGSTEPESIDLSWGWYPSELGIPVSGFNIQYGMTGFELGNGTIVDANGVDFGELVIDNELLASGVYQVYVQAECLNNGVTDTSYWAGPITVVMPFTNDDVCENQLLQLGQTYTFNNNGATVSTYEDLIAPSATGSQTTTGWTNSNLDGTLWYSFVAPASGSVRINSSAINYNGQAAVYTTSDCENFESFELIAANDDDMVGTSLAPNFAICGLTAGTTYYLMYDQFNETTGNFSLNVSEILTEVGEALPLTQVCYGQELDLSSTLENAMTGGVWSTDNAAINSNISGSILTTTGIAANTYTFNYLLVDGCVSDSIEAQVKIVEQLSAGQDGNITACKNQPIDLLTGLSGDYEQGGNWYDPSMELVTTTQVTTAESTGQFNYTYIVPNEVCPNDTAIVTVTVGDCDYLTIEKLAMEDVELYPNPSNGVVYIQSDFAGQFNLEITDVNGRVIQTGSHINTGTSTVNLKDVERGIYFFQLSSNNAEKVFRVVIQ